VLALYNCVQSLKPHILIFRNLRYKILQ